jgi:glucosamine--fructose-6-phosphate aminotransferase (isomerizing)
MCGIVGYLGDKYPREVIVEGLRRLEYRGYDSAGLAILEGNEIHRFRAEGKLKNLEDVLEGRTFKGSAGIGHTRWATHGPPSVRNAHPHQVGDIVLVHNGIIENYREIRDELIKSGGEIQSDTDSELVAHLIAREVVVRKDLVAAVEAVIPKLRGAYSVLVLWAENPDEMVAFKEGPPLVIGHGDNEVVVASDVQAIIDHTKVVTYVEDKEIAVIKRDSVKLFTVSGAPVERDRVTIDWDADRIEKGGFSHFMLKEIYEQPRSYAAATKPFVDLDEKTIRVPWGDKSVCDIENFQNYLKDVKRMYIVACGTSFYAGLYGKYLIEKLSGISVEVDIASEFRYRDPAIDEDCLFLTVSQSGETADTLAALRLAKEVGAKAISICNVKGSSIDREADVHFFMNSGPEIGVASTKAFVSTLGVFACLAADLGKVKGRLSREEEVELVDAVLSVPSHLETVLNYDTFFAEVSESLKAYRGFLYMGRGVNFPISLEGALKLKELAYLHAEGYAAGEMKHGPLALIDERMCVVMLVPDDDLFEKTLSNLEEVRARGGQVIALGTEENEKIKDLSLHYLALPHAHWMVNPVLLTIPLQLMSFHLAETLGHDVDQPRNLAKSVTVE